VLAVIVATPCTAPFMGTAVGFALSQSAPVAFAVFTALALGLALPYVLLSFVPNVAKILPRPGPWMVTLREAMAFLLFGTVVWLTWVLGTESGLGAVTFLLIDFLLLGCAAWILHRWPGRPHTFATAVVIGGLAVSAGVWQANAGTGCALAHTQAQTSDSLNWKPYSPETLAQYRLSGRPIFVDFTAAWCLTCKVNEGLMFGSADVREKLHDMNMVLLKADWTSQDPQITRALAEFGRSGVPLYVLYPKDANAKPVQLPEVVTAGLVLDELGKLH
jgi:thiol:disulfide interchange protein